MSGIQISLQAITQLVTNPLRIVDRIFFDSAGNFLRVIITAPQTTLTFTNLDNNKSVSTPSVNMAEQYANPDGTGTATLRGLLDHIIIPGQGLVAADTGRIDTVYTFDNSDNIIGAQTSFVAGQSDGVLTDPNSTILCSVLQ